MVQHKNYSLPILLVALLLINLISVSLVLAQTVDNPTAGLESATGGALDEEGIHTDKINQTAQGYKSKAEERIDTINLWLENRASWFKIVFGMVPEISWLFAINIYILLFFFVSIVLNGDSLFIFLSKSYAKLFGLVLFIIGIATKFFTNVLAIPAYKFWDFIWTYVFSTWGLVIAIIIAIVLIIILVLIAIYFPEVLVAFAKYMEKRREKAEKEKTETSQKVIQKTAEGIVGEKIS